VRQADHSYRGVLPRARARARVCVWSRNIDNEQAYSRVGLLRHGEKTDNVKCKIGLK